MKPQSRVLTCSRVVRAAIQNVSAARFSSSAAEEEEEEYFELVQPFERREDVRVVRPAKASKQPKSEKDMKLKKNQARPGNSSVQKLSRSLVDAMKTGTLPSLFQTSVTEFSDTHVPVYGDIADLHQIQISHNAQMKSNTSNTPKIGPTDDAWGQLDTNMTDLPLNWFPGHMKLAIDDLAGRFKNVSLSIEVRDARMPIGSSNPMLSQLLQTKPRLVVLNKTDLVGDSEALLKTIAKELNQNLNSPEQMVLSSKAESWVNQGKSLKLNTNNTNNTTTDMSGAFESQNYKSVSKANAKKDQQNALKTLNAEQLIELLTVVPGIHRLPSSILPQPHILDLKNRVAIILTNGTDITSVRGVLALLHILSPKRKFHSVPSSVLIAGYPNVGKSTLLNSLRVAAKVAGVYSSGYTIGSVERLHADKNLTKAVVGPTAGVTRRVEGFKVSEKPPMVVLDSPGILIPRFDRTPSGYNQSMQLALCGCFGDKAVDDEELAALLQKILNANNLSHLYARYFNLPLHKGTKDQTVLFYCVVRQKDWKEEQGEHAWRDKLLKTQFGKVLEDNILREKYAKSWKRDMEARTGFGVYGMEKDANWTHYPSTMEVQHVMSPELEKRAAGAFQRAFRDGFLGKFVLERAAAKKEE